LTFCFTPEHCNAFNNPTGAVRKGSTALGNDAFLDPENEVWVAFAVWQPALIRSLPPEVQ
jgi:hypothetical protein